MDENFILNENYTVSPMSDQHSTATISEKIVDVSNIGTFVMGEHNSSMITFQIDRYYDGVDLSDKKIKIVYKNSNGIYKSDDAEICNVKYSQKSLRFSWVVSNNVTQTTKFIAYICFISEDYLLKTENFTVQVKSSFDPSTSEPSANWFVTIEGKLEKIEKDIADNHVYDWAKQPEKPTYTPEEIGAEKAGTSDGIFRSAMKYTDGEISRLEDTVIPDNVATLEQKITDLNQSVVSLQDAKAEKVHTHLVANITDFPTSLPASDVYDWAKAETKPTYTHDEVGALSSSTHIPSTLEEMTDDQNHRTVSDVEKKTWNAKSEFSGSYNDLTDVPEIKQLTDDLKAKYDNAATLATTNKNTLDTHAIQTKELLEGLKNGYVEYQLTWIENEEVVSTGKFISQDGWKRTTYVDICDAEKIFVPSSFSVDDLPDSFLYTAVWFDENHKSIEDMSLEEMLLVYTVPPTNAKYFVISYSPMSLNIPIAKICELKEGFRTTASGQYSHAEGDGSVASGNSSHAEGHTSATGECSHAEGINSHANGRASHAEGTNTKALGMYSHAEGYLSEARNDYAHAEGCETIAIDYAHAEGNKSQASGKYSHAEGNTTTASGMYSHTEGNTTTASSDYAHAEGNGSTASGVCSHAEGQGTTALGKYSHAEGNFTKASGDFSHTSGSYTQATHSCQYAVGCGNDPQADSLFEVGNGLNAEGNLIDDTTTVFDLKTRRNAFRVTNTGYAIAQTALQIGETVITEDQLKQLIQLITNAA